MISSRAYFNFCRHEKRNNTLKLSTACPWCHQTYNDGRGCWSANLDSTDPKDGQARRPLKVTVDASLTTSASSSELGGVRSNLLCHIFDNHKNIAVEEIVAKGFDAVVAVALGLDGMVLDFARSNRSL